MTENTAERPMCQPADLGRPIPASPHAVSVCLPTWADNIGYEKGDPRVTGRMQCGYPRFFLHPSVVRLFQQCEARFAREGECCFAFPSRGVAERLRRLCPPRDRTGRARRGGRSARDCRGAVSRCRPRNPQGLLAAHGAGHLVAICGTYFDGKFVAHGRFAREEDDSRATGGSDGGRSSRRLAVSLGNGRHRNGVSRVSTVTTHCQERAVWISVRRLSEGSATTGPWRPFFPPRRHWRIRETREDRRQRTAAWPFLRIPGQPPLGEPGFKTDSRTLTQARFSRLGR